MTLKAFNYRQIYKNPVIKKHLSPIKDIFRYLFETYLNDLETRNADSMIFTDFLNGMADTYPENFTPPEIVRDYISGMTDSYFIRQAPERLRPKPLEHV